MNRKILTGAYKFISETYFPLFDRKKHWVVKYSSKIVGDGFCDDENKEIVIGKIKDNMLLQVLLIHEICHAVSGPGHGKRWKNRMLSAAKQAVSLGEKELSDRIIDDVGGYNIGLRPTSQTIYDSIVDCIIDLPKASHETVIKFVAKDYGFSPQEFKRRFKGSRRIYDEQKKRI